MRFFIKSKLMLRQMLGRELKLGVELYCKTFKIGSWAFSPIGINSSSSVFSLGIANDIRFDKGMINNFACQVHAFDPNPKWIDWISAQHTPPEFHFYPFAIGETDGTFLIDPQAQNNGGYFLPVQPLAEKTDGKNNAIEATVKRISTVMSEIRVEHIDILKMDIEAAEYEVINDVLDSGIGVYQLLVEFHHHFKTVPIEKTKAVLDKLSAAGYRIFHISDKYREFSFIHEETYYHHVNKSLNLPKLKLGTARSA
jgi:FkbM family methyltransferase